MKGDVRPPIRINLSFPTLLIWKQSSHKRRIWFEQLTVKMLFLCVEKHENCYLKSNPNVLQFCEVEWETKAACDSVSIIRLRIQAQFTSSAALRGTTPLRQEGKNSMAVRLTFCSEMTHGIPSIRGSTNMDPSSASASYRNPVLYDEFMQTNFRTKGFKIMELQCAS